MVSKTRLKVFIQASRIAYWSLFLVTFAGSVIDKFALDAIQDSSSQNPFLQNPSQVLYLPIPSSFFLAIGCCSLTLQVREYHEGNDVILAYCGFFKRYLYLNDNLVGFCSRHYFIFNYDPVILDAQGKHRYVVSFSAFNSIHPRIDDEAKWWQNGLLTSRFPKCSNNPKE